MKRATPGWALARNVLIWSLVASTLFPPAILAQGMGSGTAPIATFPGPAATAPPPGQPQPGQAILTNPQALQPISPHYVPCPLPPTSTFQTATSTGQAQANVGTQASGGPGGATLVPRAAGAVSAPSAAVAAQLGTIPGQTGFRKPTGLLEGGAYPELTLQSGALSPHPGLLSPVIQQQIEQQALPQRESAMFSQEIGIGQLSIEESFSRFFILQGVSGQLKQFGYNFFDVQFTGVPTVMDAPVGPDYVLGPQDTLALHIWNVPDSNLNRSYIMPVENDGTVFIPHVGAVPVAGSTFAQATRLIQARLSTLLKRFEMHLSMARLRTIKVFVVGEVVRPGSYEVSSLATASHALYAACGPSKQGSLRKMQVVRDGRPIAELDFYRFFLLGDRTQDVRLQAGDTLLIPPIGAVAAIGGPVRRPAIYELKDRTTVLDLIEIAGGLAPTADRERCQIFRVEAGQQRVIVDVSLGTLFKARQDLKGNGTLGRPLSVSVPVIQDGDFVRISAVPTQIENAVILAGAVRTPGPYEFKPGMRLKDLLSSEQLLSDSYLDRAELVRTDPLTYETSVIPFSPRKLLQGDTDANVELRRLDKVMVGSQLKTPRSVMVLGEVQRQGIYTIESGERLSSVLKRAGGLTSRAFPQGLVLIRESVRISQQEQLEKFISGQRAKLMSEAAALAAGSVGVQGTTTQQEQAALQIQLQALETVAARVQLGRVVVKMESLEMLEGSSEDIMLEQLDKLTVPQKPQTVNIVGSVRNPTSVVHHADMTADNYVRLAGGFNDNALKDEMYVLRADGSSDSSYVKLKDIGAGDTIVVPERVEPKMRPLALWQAVASIIGSAALAVAGIAVVGR